MRDVLLMVCLAGWTTVWAKPSEEIVRKEQELRRLTTVLEQARDDLQRDIASRWGEKQKHAARREVDKDELARLREAQERAYLELARIKEECFAGERAVADERDEVDRRREERRFLQSTLDDMLRADADAVMETFPMGREARRGEIESVREKYRTSGSVSASFAALTDYHRRYIDAGLGTGIVKQPLLVDGEGVRELTVARFGHVFGYGVDPEGLPYFIRQTGRLGIERYRIEKITAEKLAEHISLSMPSWVEADTVGGAVPTDVLQNDRSRVLVGGDRITIRRRLFSFVGAGGWVMVPLLMLPLWALVLVVMKMWNFSRRHRIDARTTAAVLDALDRGDRDAATACLRSRRGTVAGVVEACMNPEIIDRTAAEEKIREIILAEIPRLSSHLNTLAVIAAVAPLLGLLGTVSGMIRLFTVITHYGTGDPRLMAGGISEALITTQTGLSIAIPILLVHNYLRNRRTRIRAEMERVAVVILNRLWPTRG